MAYNAAVNIAGSGVSSGGSSLGLSLAQLDQRYLDVAGGDNMLVNLDAGNNNVINVLDPINTQDVATKNYVDNSINTSTISSLFPVLTANSGGTNAGWIASASSEFSSAFAAYKVTTTNDWATQTQTTNYWIQIQVPSSIAAVKPTQIALKGRVDTETPATWKFDCSNDGINYRTILTNNTTITSTSPLFFAVSSSVAYRYFRIFAFTSTSGALNPGLSLFQVYYISISAPKFLKVDGSNNLSVNLNMIGNLINNLGIPLVATDAVNKQYVDTSLSTVKKKQTVGIFPQQWYLDVSYNQWIAAASSEYSS